jgi:hypothetical protein
MPLHFKKSFALRDNKIQEVDDGEVDVELLSPNNFFSTHINLIPMHSAVQGPRLFYGARFYNQALPLVKPDAPLVQNLDSQDKDGQSFDEKLGKIAGAVVADDDGEVVDLTPDFVKLRKADGSIKSFDLYNNFPFNRKTSCTHTPLINKGDIVKRGQMMAKSNYTSDNGSLALGANARVGLVPFKGYSMDDAIVISNSFAKRLTSDHSYTMEQDYDNDVKGGLNHYVSLFPTQFTKDQLKRFDATGVVKPGTVVKQGDPLILATRPRVFSSTTAQLGKLSKAMRQSRHDSSQLWDSEFDGTVTDVAKTKTGYKVIVKSEAPAQMGDKIVFRSGQKGVIANILSDDHMPRTKDGNPLEVLLNPLGIPCYDSETEFLTDTGWIPATEVSEEHNVATLNAKTFCIEFQKPTEIYHIPYEGLMYKFVNQQLDILVTPEHNQFSAPRRSPKIYGSITPSDSAVWPLFELNKAKDIFGQPRRYAKAALWEGHTPSEFYIPAGSIAGNTNKPKDGFYVDTEKWVKFMGWYTSEGSAYINKGKKGNSYIVEISQSRAANPDKYAEISELLDSMPFNYVYKGKTGFRIYHKGLYEKLSILGKARDKYIPRDILNLSPKFLNLFLSCAIKGDGNKYSNAKTGHVDCLTYTTASKTLAGNIQEIAAKLGISVNIKKENRRGSHACYYLSLKKRSPFVWTNWSDKTKQADRQEEAWVNYKGLVHCVTVPNGVLFVRRNGKAVFSGNSRVNNGLIYELLLGKAASKLGQPIKVPSFNKPGERWYDFVAKTLKDNDLAETEEVFDPMSNRLLENPITVGVGHILKLHHTSACFDDKTEVLTNNGWKLWENIHPEDLIATSETTGNELFFEKPLHLFKYKYNGNLCAFQGRYIDYAVTPNHNLWCQDYYSGKNFRLRSASEVHGRRFKIKQFGFSPQATISPSVFKLGNKEFAWDDFCEFVGWWVTEGCVGSNKCSVLIYQSNSANPEKTQRIEALLNRMGVKWSPYLVYGKRMGFAINEKSFAAYFSSYGSHSQFKRVPRELITGAVSGCRRIVEAILLGDGSHCVTETGPSVKLTTTSKQLADDFQELCIRIGAGSIIRPLDREWKKFKNNPHYLDGWSLSYTETRDVSQVDGDRNSDGFRLIPYSGNVYCAEMRTGLLYVRRNGKPMLSGNSKASARGQGGYDLNQQPLKGGGDAAKAKRLSGLEVHSLLSAGAYKTLREGATLRGQKNDEYWRALRQGYKPKPPGAPFVWEKFQTLLTGAGLHARKINGGKLRLGPFTDDDLDKHGAVDIKSGDLVDMNTMDPVQGGLFDQAVVGNNKWGKISLPFKVPNPAFEPAVRHLLGLTEKELRGIMSGQMELPHNLR